MNLEEELTKMYNYTESGMPIQLRNGRVEIEGSAAPDIVAPLRDPELQKYVGGLEADPFRPQPPVSAFPGQPAESLALGTPGEPGAAARLNVTEFEKGVGGGVLETAQQTINAGAELIDYVGGLIGKDPKALDAVRNLLPQVKPETTFGEIVKTITNVGTSFALLRGMGVRTTAALPGAEALADPEQGNLASMAVQLGFAPELFKYLDSKVGKDADAEERLLSRMTNVLVDVGLGAAISGIFAGVKVLKGEGGQYVDKIKGLLRDDELAKGGQTLFSTPVIGGVARPEKGTITKFDKKTGETFSDFAVRLDREAPIVSDPETFTKTYGGIPQTSPEMPSSAVALRTATERTGTPQLVGGTFGDGKTFAPAFAQVGAYFDSLVRMKNNGNPRSWSAAADKTPILQEAANEVAHQIGLAKPGARNFTKVTGWGWYDEDIAKAYNTAASVAPELRIGAKRGLVIPSQHWDTNKGRVTPAEARILVAAVGAPQSFGNPAVRNFDIALQAYEIFRKTGQFPERGMIRDEAGNVVPTGKYWTQRGVSAQYIGILNTLLRENGPGDTVRWLTSEHTVAELRGLKRRATNAAGDVIFKGDSSMGISGQADMSRLGAYVFGPKGGQFLGNLTGHPGTTTDMWFTRTWNRYLGRSREGQGALADTGVVEQPRNLVERREMADFSRTLTDTLNKDTALIAKLGRPLTERDTQAVLWYFEQNLYSDLGIKVKPTSFGEGADVYAKRAKEQGGTGIQTIKPTKPKK
jgi:hypothetical protein